MAKYSNPKGTRDFSPLVMAKRQYVFDTIRDVFETFGLMQIETPALENLNTLTGKYGEEGDKLMFKVLNSGDYLKKANASLLESKDSKKLTSFICDRALRYDLTVPLARYVVQHQNEIQFPFKRYHIGPVWRADRPQKGRYREFYQCDADCLGSKSLLLEVELMQVFYQVFNRLNLQKEIRIQLNNRKILQGMADIIGISDHFIDFTVALDKLDKIGIDKVLIELKNKEIEDEKLKKIKALLITSENNSDCLRSMKDFLKNSPIGLEGIAELEFIMNSLKSLDIDIIDFQMTLARGLNYYTGSIYEVIMIDQSMGSLGSGGRYDNLTEIFGLKDLSGVGISFGADRICDVLESKNLYPKKIKAGASILFVNLNSDFNSKILTYLKELRAHNIHTDFYPDSSKLKKQMKYANELNIPYVAIIGEDEFEHDKITLKNMIEGTQEKLSIEKVIEIVKGDL